MPEEAAGQIEEWLEVEEVLRHSLPYSLLSSNAELIRRLAVTLEHKDYLVGQQLSLADVALYSTLLPALIKYPVRHRPAFRKYKSLLCGSSDLACCVTGWVHIPRANLNPTL